MRSVRIEPIKNGTVLLVDITCECGNNGLTNTKTTETSFKHEVVLGSREDIVLECGTCSQTYTLNPQDTHIHIEG